MRKSFDELDETYAYRRVHADLAAWGAPAGTELGEARAVAHKPKVRATVVALMLAPQWP